MSICKICGDEYYQLRRHLRSYHQIDPMDYWVKYVSTDHKYPVCKNCGDPIHHFINDSFDCGPGVYCCKQCMDEDLPNVLSERHKNGVYEGTSYLTTTWNSNIDLRRDSLAKTCYYRVLRDADPFSKGYFYLVKLEENSIKFGATRQDPDYYIPLRYHYFNYTILGIYEGTLLSVAGIEYLIKVLSKFKEYFQEGYVSSTEELTVDSLPLLTEFINKSPRIKRII